MSGSHSTRIEAGKHETSVNVDAVTGQHQEFSAHRPADKPLSTGGHQPGSKHSPYDTVPTFHAETLPPGTAPKEDTYEPQNIESRPRGAGDEATQSWADSLPGATSKDTNTGLGKPGQGMSSVEEHHDGHQGRKKEKRGLEGKFGKGGTGNFQIDTSEDPKNRGLDRD